MYMDSCYKDKWSWDYLIFIMEIQVLVRRHLYNEPASRLSGLSGDQGLQISDEEYTRND